MKNIKKLLETSIARKLMFRLFMLLLSAAIIIEAVFAISFREQGIKYALSKADTTAYLVRDGLTSLMVMGVIQYRDSYIKRLEHIKDIERIRVVRGAAVDRQFGPGLPIEQPKGKLENIVLSTGEPIHKVYETPSIVLIRDIIPYKASNTGIINCLQCHQVRNGEVLGAIDITLNITYIRYKAIMVMLFTFLIFIFLFGVLFYSIYRFSKPYINEFGELINSFTLLQEGRLEEAKINKKIAEEHADEAGKVIVFFNKMVDVMENTLKDIYEKTLTLIGYDVMKSGNFIKDTDKIVTELTNIYKFKTTIEKDNSKDDIYKRLYMILYHYMSLDKFSFYEINYDKMNPIFVEGADQNENNLWCKNQILRDNSCCRAFRTGSDVDSQGFPDVCDCFIKEIKGFNKDENTLEYYCIPIYLNGQVHNVLQIVYENYMEEFIRMMIPYIKGYIDEAIPVMESKLLMEKLKEQSIRDQLTGFYNRRYIEDSIEQILNTAKRRGSTTAILMLDIDHFKEINDTYGHDVGDMVLKNISKAIKESIRESDIAIRFGGEEFMVILIDVKPDDAILVAEKIRKNVESRIIVLPNGNSIKRTISIGITEIPTDTEKFWQAVKFADVALYKAKETGRNKVIRYKKEMWQEEEY